MKTKTKYNIIVRKDLQHKLIKLGQKNHCSVTRIVEELLQMAETGGRLFGEIKYQ